MAAVLFCIYSSLAVMIIFKAQMCFIVLRVSDQELQWFWLLLIFIHEIKTYENEMLRTVLCICCLRLSNRDTKLFTGFCFLYISMAMAHVFG